MKNTSMICCLCQKNCNKYESDDVRFQPLEPEICIYYRLMPNIRELALFPLPEIMMHI